MAYFGRVILGTCHFKSFFPSDCPRRDNRQHAGEKRPRIKEDEGSRYVKIELLKIKLVSKAEEQEVDIEMKDGDQHHVAFAGTIKSLKFSTAVNFPRI